MVPGAPAFACGSGWTPVTIETVWPDRVLVHGRRAGSATTSTYSVFDSRNLLERRLLSAKELELQVAEFDNQATELEVWA
jgi:hypothetical protein